MEGYPAFIMNDIQIQASTWMNLENIQFSSVQSLSCVRLFVTPWTAARQASLSITNSQSFLKLMSIELVMPSSHLILCCSLLLLPPIPPSIRVFENIMLSQVIQTEKGKYYMTVFGDRDEKEVIKLK